VGHVLKVELEVVLQRGRPDLSDELMLLPQIFSCRHMERYSCGGLDSAGCKVGLVSQGVGRPDALLGPPGWALAYAVTLLTLV
jgi:hypothetical protein